MSTIIEQKGGDLEGMSDEALASSKSVFDTNFAGGKTKGLQQWFTPEKAAKLVADVIGTGVTVLDPTAGNGSLLQFFDKTLSYGVELDEEQIKNSEGAYHAIRGDLQHVYALLRRTFEFDAIVANPPFGLDWEEPTLNDGKKTNSALLTLMMLNRLLTTDGQFAFINAAGRWDKECAKTPDAAGVYAVIDIPDLFPGTTTPAVLAFGVHPSLREGEAFQGAERREMALENLDLLGQWVKETRQKAIGHGRVAYRSWNSYDIARNWPVIQKEYDRRTDERLKDVREAKFDVELFGGDRINVVPSPYTSLVLQKKHKLHSLSRLNGASVNYFIQNERDWNALMMLKEDGLVSVEPRAIEAVEAALFDTRKVLTPLYALKPVQRLGFLSDVDSLLCVKSDPTRGFDAGIRYDLSTDTATLSKREIRPVQIKSGKRAGEWEDREFTTYRKVLKITVGHWTLMDSEQDAENIQYLVDHFEMPDPGDVGTKYPEETEKFRKLILQIEEEVIYPNSLAFRDKHGKKEDGTWKFPAVRFRRFQVEDLARLLVKDDGLISWEQGLGKTLGAITFALAHIRLNNTKEQVLITAPKDLIPQWQRECERFTGKKMTLLKSHGQAKAVDRRMKRGGTGWYVTYPEALSIVGTRASKPAAEIVVEEKEVQKLIKGTDKWGYWKHHPDGYKVICDYYDPDKAGYGHVPARFATSIKQITSKEVCPQCRSDRRSGWNGLYCEAPTKTGGQCGYAHYSVRVKPMGSLLSTAFKRGVVILDEATMIGGSANGGDSKRSLVIRGIRAKRKLAMTGTPIKNYISQAYWVMWWALGNNTPRFGYSYDGGKLQFEENFSVIEVARGRDGKQTGRKSMPEITNLSRFWRMTASSFIRRRKEDTGEKIVPRVFFDINVPLGEQQQKQANKWAKTFAKFFREKYPEKDYDPAWVEQAAPLLGLGQKFEYAEVIPLADPDYDWVPDAETDPLGLYQDIEVSNFTPATLKAMELAMALVKDGQKVLVGSPLVKSSRFLAEQLQTKGVHAIHVLDETDNTQNPDKRAETVFDFQSNEVDVLCTGVQAIRFGHNLDAASAVILVGLPWDFETMDQFIARVHRLTSKRPVRVYVVVPGKDTVSEKKWNLLKMKGDTSSLALDGRIVKKTEEEIDQATIIRELMDKGVPLTGDEVPESHVEKVWAEFPQLSEYEPPANLLGEIPMEEAERPAEFPLISDVLAQLDKGFKKHCRKRAAARALEAMAEQYRARLAAEAVDAMAACYRELLEAEKVEAAAQEAAAEAEENEPNVTSTSTPPSDDLQAVLVQLAEMKELLQKEKEAREELERRLKSDEQLSLAV